MRTLSKAVALLLTLKVCLSDHNWEFERVPFRDVFTGLRGVLSVGNESEFVVWQIRVPVGYQIQINFSIFQLPYSEHCLSVNTVLLSTQKNHYYLYFCGDDRSNGPKLGHLYQMSDRILNVSYEPYSYYSYFPSRFKMHYNAIDVDECSSHNGGCSHFCHNSIGSYYCSCPFTHQLDSDRKTCLSAYVLRVGQNCSHNITVDPERKEAIGPWHLTNFTKKLNCDWAISFPLDYNIELRLTKNDADDRLAEAHCPYEPKIANKSGVAYIYCGSSAERLIFNSSENTIAFRFITDDRTIYGGFRVQHYVMVPPCSDAPVPENGGKEGSDYAVGAFVHYYCDKGYELRGSTVIRCNEDSTWNGTRPRCYRVPCRNPDRSNHGTTTSSSGTKNAFYYQDQVTSTCDEYYERASGNYTRSCTENGTWSGKPLTCRPKCGKKTFLMNWRGKVSYAKHPWIALLFYDDPCVKRNCAFCGGVVINEKFILTAAHCVRGKSQRREFVVRLGAHQTPRGALSCKPKDVHYPDIVDGGAFRGDLLLVEIANCTSADDDVVHAEIVLSEYIRPICLPDESTRGPSSYGKIQAIRWSQQGNWTFAPFQLRHSYLTVANRDACQVRFAEERREFFEDEFCAFVHGGRKSCAGKSGSPVVVKNRGKFVVLGIGSRKEEVCGKGSYGVYGDVSHHLEWIKETSKYDD